VTLKFIGHTQPERLEAICAALSAVRSDTPVELRFRGLGFFPNGNRPRVCWAGVQACPNLAALAGKIDKSLEQLGVPGETRLFAPHLTLARFEPPIISGKIHAVVESNISQDFGTLRTNEFHLFQSLLKPSGAEYTIVRSFSFSTEA
jgi:2'-5' RNA ligase